jgi:replicative DNA helicase
MKNTDVKRPLCNYEAEKIILGCMMIDVKDLSLCMKKLVTADFANELYSRIFDVCCALYSNNEQVDIITVSDKLGDYDCLSAILDAYVTSANLKSCISIVKSLSIKRQHIKAAEEIINITHEGNFETIQEYKNTLMSIIDIEIKDIRKTKTKLQDIASDVITTLKSEEEIGIPYGLNFLDDFVGGAYKQELTILGARPSIGKTALSIQVAINIAKMNKHVAIFSLEMSKEQIVNRILSSAGKVIHSKLKNRKKMMDSDFIALEMAIKKLPGNVNIYDNVLTIEEIRGELRTLHNAGMLDFVVIDYMQLVETTRKVGNSNERVSYISRQFKLLAKEFDIPVWVLSQFSRAGEKVDKQKARPPILSDLRDSGSIEQDADNVFFLHDESNEYSEEIIEQQELMFIIAKQRSGERKIMKRINFNRDYQKFSDKLPVDLPKEWLNQEELKNRCPF